MLGCAVEKGREHDLITKARAFMADALGYEPNMLFEEVPSPWGRADLVGVRSASPSPARWTPIGRSAFSLISVLEMERSIGVDGLVDRFGMTRRSLIHLASAPLARSMLQVNGHNLTVGPQPMTPFGQICAVEIKLRDWRAGLSQALRYKTFSDQVYVFLGDLPKATSFDPFRRSRVGLVQLSPEPRLVLEAAETSDENVGLCRRVVEENIAKLAWGPMQRPF